MKALRILVVFLLCVYNLNAQQTGIWSIHSNLKNVRSSIVVNNSIWAITGGGMFQFSSGVENYLVVNKADGLNSQSISAIAVDAKGKLWLGTEEGHINVYDPNTASIERMLDIYNSGKSKKQINNIFVKGDSVIVSADFGIVVISASKFSLLDSYLKLGAFTAESKVINAFKSNLFYVCTENGIAIQKPDAVNLTAPDSWENYKTISQIAAESVNKIIQYNSQIYCASSNGIYQFQNKSWQKVSLNGFNILDLSVNSNGMYAITQNTLYSIVNNTATKIYENNNVTFNSITASQNQTYYISTSGGLIELKNNIAKNYFPNGPESNSFMSLAVDQSGKLWVATGKDKTGIGFLEYNGSSWKTYNKQTFSNLNSNAIYNVSVGSDTTLFLGTWGNGATLYKKGNFQAFTKQNSGMTGIPSSNDFIVITDIKEDSKGNVWFMNAWSATLQPLSVLTKDKKWYHFPFTSVQISSAFFDKMVIDNYDTKWFFPPILGNKGLYYFNEKNTFENSSDDIQGYITENDGLISNDITSLAVDKRGYLWIGTSAGVSVITDPSKPKVIDKFTMGRAVRSIAVTCIAIDPIDQKWIGTKNGVFVIPADGYNKLIEYNTSNSPLPSNDIKSIAFEPKSGTAYIGTDYGLAAISTSFIQPKTEFADLFIYPHPFIIKSDLNNSVTIDGLIKSSLVKIYDITGKLIAEITPPGGRLAFWDGKDINGNLVASGVYIIVAHDQEANQVKTSKIAVIRK